MSKTCLHCEQPLPKQAVEGKFCCAGCAGAYHLLQSMNLTSYYDQRCTVADVRPLIPESCTLQGLETYIQRENGEATLHLMVDGLHCAACVWLIETVLARQTGVTHARLNMTTRRLVLRWQEDKTNAETLLKEVYKLGYRLLPYDPALLHSTTRQEEKFLLLCLAVAGFAAANVMLLSVGLWAGAGEELATARLMQAYSALIVLPAALWAGQPFYRSAWQALRHKSVNMDVPITLALVITLGLSVYDTLTAAGETYFESAAMLLFFLLIGRYLDSRARGKSRHAAEQLAALQATVATVKRAGQVVTLPLAEVQVGDTLLVARGERLAADGTLQTTAELDSSLLTGESLPQSHTVGAAVQAGMLNVGAPLMLTVTAVGQQTAMAQMIQLVETATQSKNKYTRLADRVARWYAPVVHSLAGLTWLGWLLAGAGGHAALTHAAAVLLVTCPCALALAVPAVQVAVVSRLLRQGIVLTQPVALEHLRRATHILLDKTGTLTTGRFHVANGGTKAQRAIAAALAVHSRHPLAQALAVQPTAYTAKNIEETAGGGLSGTVNGHTYRLGSRAFCEIPAATLSTAANGQTEVWLAGPQTSVCFVCEDTLRPDAAAAIRTLQKQGLQVEILSGDRPAAVQYVAQQVAVEQWQAAATPADKFARLQSLKAAHHHPVMVGDGINDAPSLAAADVGISFGDASHIAQTGADVLLQHNRLQDVPRVIRLGRTAHRAVLTNFGLSFSYNVIAIPLAVAGVITPLWAAVFMSASSLTVVLNALRIGLAKR